MQAPLPVGQGIPSFMKVVLLPKPFGGQQFQAVTKEPLEPLLRPREVPRLL